MSRSVWIHVLGRAIMLRAEVHRYQRCKLCRMPSRRALKQADRLCYQCSELAYKPPQPTDAKKPADDVPTGI